MSLDSQARFLPDQPAEYEDRLAALAEYEELLAAVEDRSLSRNITKRIEKLRPRGGGLLAEARRLIPIAIVSPSSAESRIGFAARFAALRVLDTTCGR